MRAHIAWLAALAFASVMCMARPVAAAESDMEATEGKQATKATVTDQIAQAYAAVRSRLVYIEAKRIPAKQDCTEDLFKDSSLRDRGTGILLRNNHVLTAFHVALKEVNRGLIRCYAIYREVDGIRRAALALRRVDDTEWPDQFGPRRDLAILVLIEAIKDPSLQACPPISARPLKRGDTVFVNGYNGETIDIANGKPIKSSTLPPVTVTADCDPSGLCNLSQAIPSGFSGSPVIDQSQSLVGVFKKGDNVESLFEPLLAVRSEVQQFCDPVSSVSPQQDCAKVRAQYEQAEVFATEPKRIRCDGAGRPIDVPTFARYRTKDGFRISGFVDHEDKTEDSGNGWIGHAEYTVSDDGRYVTEVRVDLGCNGATTATGQPGWAATRIFGTIKRILNDNEKSEIKKACNAQ
jgi:hypothetical protein